MFLSSVSNALVMRAMCDGNPVPGDVLQHALKAYPPIIIRHQNEHDEHDDNIWDTLKVSIVWGSLYLIIHKLCNYIVSIR